jgi:hypothetical protein
MLYWRAALRANRRVRRETIIDTSAGYHGGDGAKQLMRSLED